MRTRLKAGNNHLQQHPSIQAATPERSPLWLSVNPIPTIIFQGMMARPSLLVFALTLLVAAAVTACGNDEAQIELERKTLAQEDAELLSQEIFDLVDQAAAYQSSHNSRPPQSLRTMGVDSLTPTTARWIETRAGTAWISVAFRRLSGHAVARCAGDADVLEQLALEGAFRLQCSLVKGPREEFVVGRVSP